MNITLIGSGHVAHHLAIHLKEAGHSIIEVYSRRQKNAKSLAKLVGAIAISDLQIVDTRSDVFICAIHDDAIQKVLLEITSVIPENSILAHTSGVYGLEVFPSDFKNNGIFYPLQTFTKGVPVDMGNVPIFIDGRYTKNRNTLKHLAESISQTVISGISNEDKQTLHMAAVFANNFTNHLISVAKMICEESNLDFNLLRPLIHQTIRKLDFISPEMAQTGPATRNDEKTMENHIRLLRDHPKWQELYALLSKSIVKN